MISTNTASIRAVVTMIETAMFDGTGNDRDTPASRFVWLGERLQRAFDRLIAASSEVADEPILDVRDFPWTAALRGEWRAIRVEAAAIGNGAVLWARGRPRTEIVLRCPATAQLLADVPGLDSAVVSTLAPGAHIPDHRGATKRLIACHLGLVVPRDGDVRMRIADRVVRWAEGETLVFDDTWRHELWNEADGPRQVLALRFARPLRQPGKGVADLLSGIARKLDRAAYAAS